MTDTNSTTATNKKLLSEDSFHLIGDVGLAIPTSTSAGSVQDILLRKLGQIFAIADSMVDIDKLEDCHRTSLQAIGDLALESEHLQQIFSGKQHRELTEREVQS